MALPMPGRGAGDERDPGGERLGGGHPLELGLLEGPVLDAELLRLVDRGVRREPLRAAHHVDRVGVELPGHAGGLLVLAVGEHPDARHQDDQRVGATHRRPGPAEGLRVAVVVRRVVGAVGLVQLGHPLADPVQRGGRRHVEHHRLDLGAQEVVGAAGAELGQPHVVPRGEEVEDDPVVGEVPDHRPVLRGHAAQQRGQLGRACLALRGGEGLVLLEPGAEGVLLRVLLDVALGGADHPQRVLLARRARVAPRGDPVAAEDAADRLRVGLLDGRDVEAELEAGPAPRHPHHLVAVHLPGERLAVRGGRDRDPGVGVQVVDVRGVDEAVHRGVDRRRRTALAVQAVVERRDHLVLALDARVDVDQRPHPVQPQHGQPRRGQRAQVAAGALHPQQLDVLTGHRVGLGALRGGVAARVVGVLRVLAQAVGPLDQVGDG